LVKLCCPVDANLHIFADALLSRRLTALPLERKATGMSTGVSTVFSDTFAETDVVHFQMIQLGQATYLWMGTDEARQDALALGVPTSSGSQPATGTTLLGNGSDTASQTMAQRLARKLGHPVFVSINLPDSMELRYWAERRALTALKGAPPASQVADVTDPAAAAAKTSAAPPAATPEAAASSSTPASGGGGPAPPAHRAVAEPDAGAGARTYEVFESKATLGEAAAAMVVAAAKEAIRARGAFLLGLSGGSIPALVSPALIAAAEAGGVVFEHWHIFLADERYVPIEHADSNLGEWSRSFLSKVPIPHTHVHGLDVSVPLEQAASLYEKELVARAASSDATGAPTPPRLDAVLLGMGPDGHTASLFESHPLLEETSRWVAPIGDSPKPPPSRITLTLPALNASRLCVFLVTGASKADKVRDAFSPEPSAPAGLVLATTRTHWMLDAPAASALLEDEAKQADLYG
jgi:6-phosphogluconolactonase